MKRLALTLAALAAAIGPLAGDLAHAQGRGHDGRGGEGRQGGWDRGRGGEGRAYPQGEGRGPYQGGPYQGGPYRGGPYVDGPYPGDPYGYERRGPGRGNRYEEDRRRPGRGEPGPYDRGSSAYPAPYPRAPGMRPGGYLPPSWRGAPVEDFRRYRLRPPPHGYSWVRVGDGFALVSPNGQIFDMVR